MRHIGERSLKRARAKIVRLGYEQYDKPGAEVRFGKVLAWHDHDRKSLVRVEWSRIGNSSTQRRCVVLVTEEHPDFDFGEEAWPSLSDLYVGPEPVEPENSEPPCEECGGRGLLDHDIGCEAGHASVCEAMRDALDQREALARTVMTPHALMEELLLRTSSEQVSAISAWGNKMAGLALIEYAPQMAEWRSIALWLADCHAGTATYDGKLSTTSKARRERFKTICRDAAKMLVTRTFFGHRNESNLEGVIERLNEAAKGEE